MKTIKGLIRAIEDNNGELNIGNVRFSFSDMEDDINIYLENTLVAWIGEYKDIDHSTILEKVNTKIINVACFNEKHNNFEKITKELEELKEDVNNLTDENIALKGQREALEKKMNTYKAKAELLDRLLNRNINIGRVK